jgi:hypothetical protein
MDTPTENIKRLESELEHQEEELREDLTQIKTKMHATRVELSPNKLIEHKLLPISVLAFLLGFALGYRGHSLEKIAEEASH